MPSVLALLSKSFFESKMAIGGSPPGLGDVAPLDRYLSRVKRLEALGSGDALFLVTVRPPDESLWLVAVLESPTFQMTHWEARPNSTPVTDITALQSQFVFDGGKGLTAKPGRLGMSLQTPRILTDGDVKLLRTASGSAPAKAAGTVATESSGRIAARDALLTQLRSNPEDASLRERAARACADAGEPARAVDLLRGHFIHLNACDVSALPCLCKKCLDGDSNRAEAGGLAFTRDFAIAEGRVIYFWVPEELDGQRRQVAASVAANLRQRYREAAK